MVVPEKLPQFSLSHQFFTGKVLFSVNIKYNYFLKIFFRKILYFFIDGVSRNWWMCPKLPKILCKIWVGSLIGLRTISTLSREWMSKIRTISLSQKSLVFIKKSVHEIISLYLSLFELCFFLVYLEKQVVEKFWSWQLQQLGQGIDFLLSCEEA